MLLYMLFKHAALWEHYGLYRAAQYQENMWLQIANR